MRTQLVIAAALVSLAAPAFAQTPSADAVPAGPMDSKQVDQAYIAECSPKASPELCSCLVAVADFHINDVAERKIFYSYTVGDFEKARADRALFEPERNMKFNIALQKAETMVHQQCDKLRPAQQAPAAPAPK